MAASLPLIRVAGAGRAVSGRGGAESADELFALFAAALRRRRLVRERTDDVLAASDVVDHRVGHRDRAGSACTSVRWSWSTGCRR